MQNASECAEVRPAYLLRVCFYLPVDTSAVKRYGGMEGGIREDLLHCSLSSGGGSAQIDGLRGSAVLQVWQRGEGPSGDASLIEIADRLALC